MNCCLVLLTPRLEHGSPGKYLVPDNSVVVFLLKKALRTFLLWWAVFLQSSRQRRGPDDQLVVPCSEEKVCAPPLCRQIFVITASFHLKLVDWRQFHGCGFAVIMLFCLIGSAKFPLQHRSCRRWLWLKLTFSKLLFSLLTSGTIISNCLSTDRYLLMLSWSDRKTRFSQSSFQKNWASRASADWCSAYFLKSWCFRLQMSSLVTSGLSFDKQTDEHSRCFGITCNHNPVSSGSSKGDWIFGSAQIGSSTIYCSRIRSSSLRSVNSLLIMLSASL